MRTIMRAHSFLALLGSVSILACSSSGGGGGAAACSDAGTCANGLVCVADLCVAPEGGTGATGGASSGGSAGSTTSGGSAGSAGTGGVTEDAGLGGAAGSAGSAPLCSGTPENGGTATAGVTCQAAGSVACAGNAQATTLECDATTCTWNAGTPCASGQACDTTNGSCKAKIAGCTAGGAVCIGGVRHDCGPDLVSTTASPCPAGAPQCTGAGVCVGCTSASDCPVPTNPCLLAACNSGTCGTQQKSTGSGCGSNKVCNASAVCACTSGYQDCDGSPSSCEAYVATDSQNCGACGNSCQGGTCSNGACQATPIVTWGAGLNEPIASDGSYVYFADNSSIRRVAVSGGSSTYLVSSGGTVRGLAVDASYVYWANLNDLWRAPKSGGAGTILSNLADGSEIVVTSYEVYFADVIGGNIWSVPKTGGSPTLIASGQVQYSGASLAMVFSDMAGDNGKVVWTLDGNGFGSGVLRQGTPFGGSVTTLASASRPMAVALDGSTAYWVDGNSGVYKYDIGTSGLGYLAPWSTPRWVSDVLVAGNYAYVSSPTASYTQTLIERVLKTGGSLQTVAQVNGMSGHMTQDSVSIYFVAGDSIYRISK
jgi:hypothetical protein